MQNPPMIRGGSPTSRAHSAAIHSHSGLCPRKYAEISATHASGPTSSNSRVICSRVDSATRGNALILSPITVQVLLPVYVMPEKVQPAPDGRRLMITWSQRPLIPIQDGGKSALMVFPEG